MCRQIAVAIDRGTKNDFRIAFEQRFLQRCKVFVGEGGEARRDLLRVRVGNGHIGLIEEVGLRNFSRFDGLPEQRADFLSGLRRGLDQPGESEVVPPIWINS